MSEREVYRVYRDGERREVARRLRGGYDVVSDAHGRFWLNGTLFGMDITARSEERIRDGLARLADLIDPDCEDGRYEGVRTARPVDRDALLALADDIDKQTDGGMFDAWLEDGHYIARRIREACGEEVRNG